MPMRFNGVEDKTDRGYYKFISGENEFGSTVQIECYEKGSKKFGSLLKFTK